MADWLAKILGRVSAKKPDTRGGVREAISIAMRSRSKLYLEFPHGIVAATLIEQVTQEEIVIAQPSIGGLTYPLAFGESLNMTFVNDRTHYSGRTKCLGRMKVQAGARGALYAYRLSIPESLKSEERRVAPRAEFMPEIAPEAQLYVGGSSTAVHGQLTSISMSGARIHTSQPLSTLSLGQEMYLKCAMSEPVGVLDEIVEVQRLEPDHRTGMNIVGVQFRRRVDRLELLMRFPSDRLTQAAAQASPQRKIA
jgi:hypothetical protein